MKKIKWIPAMLLLCLAAACNKDDDNNSNNNSQNLTTADRDFMTRASYGNNAEVGAGTVAASQGSMAMVRNFGTMMVTDHTRAQAEMVALGAQVGKTDLPTTPDSAHVRMTEMLKTMSGRAFDSMYMKMQVVDHQATIDLMQSQINNGSNQRVKDYANMQLPHIQMHKRMADSIVTVNGF